MLSSYSPPYNTPFSSPLSPRSSTYNPRRAQYTGNETGIDAHKDDGRVNVNIWITPDDANLAPGKGGLKIFQDDGKLGLQRGMALNRGAAGRKALDNLPHIRVPYRQNRLVLFNSALVHYSDVGQWKDGYLNRRVSLTFIYGEPCGDLDNPPC